MSERTVWKSKVEPVGRSALGFTLGPLIGGVAAGLALWLLGLLLSVGHAMPGEPGSLLDLTIFAVLVGGYYGATMGIPTALVLGWPLHALLIRLRISHALAYAIIGSALALLAYLFFTSSRLVLLPYFLVDLLNSGAAVLAGAIGGWIFWLIRRPDRDRSARSLEISQ
jgi:hypothetical protein